MFDLHDEYCHGRMDRRVFLANFAAVTAGGVAMAQTLLPRYARAKTISFTDPRIKARYVSCPSLGGTSGTMRAYLVQPAGNGPFPTVLVIHENRGLNPYIEDVARCAATEGFRHSRPMSFPPSAMEPSSPPLIAMRRAGQESALRAMLMPVFWSFVFRRWAQLNSDQQAER